MLRQCVWALVLVSLGALAQAEPIVWDEELKFQSDIGLGSVQEGALSRFQYSHNLANVGFVVGDDQALSATLSLALRDDSSRDNSEWAHISLLGSASSGLYEIDFVDIDVALTLQALVLLNASGQLEIVIEQLAGDFILTGSRLIAQGERSINAVSVSEPSIFLLLSVALVLLLGVQPRDFYSLPLRA